MLWWAPVPRPPSPAVRRALIDRAAALLARREPVTLRSLVAGTGVSTMAVYTYFDGMVGLWGAVRQEGFTRLADRLATVAPSTDPVRHLAALGVAYVENGLANPDLYRVMFDSTYELPDPAVAAATFEPLVEGAAAARAAGRFGHEPLDVAQRYWATGHGLTSLAVTGVLPMSDLERHAPALTVAVFIGAGDAPERAERSVRAAWRGRSLTAPSQGRVRRRSETTAG
jgi:AcrR family transcriptional regulator